MKREMNLIREILLWAEKQDHGYINKNPDFEGHSAEEIGYHVHLIGQAGLAIVRDDSNVISKSPSAYLSSLTNEGYEFIGAARDETLWAKAQAKFLNGATSVTLCVIQKWLESQIG